MKEVCYDVKVEANVIPLENDQTKKGNVLERVRLDVPGVGVQGSYEKIFLALK